VPQHRGGPELDCGISLERALTISSLDGDKINTVILHPLRKLIEKLGAALETLRVTKHSDDVEVVQHLLYNWDIFYPVRSARFLVLQLILSGCWYAKAIWTILTDLFIPCDKDANSVNVECDRIGSIPGRDIRK
jgi:hypothetical protein